MYHFPLVPKLIERHGWKAGSPAFYHGKIPQKIRADVLDWHLWPSVLHTGVRSTKAEYTLEYPLYYHLQLQLPRWNVSSAAFVMERCTWFWYVSPLRLRLFLTVFGASLIPAVVSKLGCFFPESGHLQLQLRHQRLWEGLTFAGDLALGDKCRVRGWLVAHCSVVIIHIYIYMYIYNYIYIYVYIGIFFTTSSPATSLECWALGGTSPRWRTWWFVSAIMIIFSLC